MKRLVLFLFLFPFFLTAGAQLTANFNLVPNPGFEHNNSGLVFTDTGFSGNSLCWVKANGFPGAVYQYIPPSVYNPNDLRPNTGKGFGVVTIGGGVGGGSGTYIHNVGFSDTAYVGRTYYQTKLLEPLLPGTRYFYSMYVGALKHSDAPDFIIANIGAHFSVTQIRDYGNPGRINRSPQVNFPAWQVPKSDTFVYVKLTGSFVASGGEEYLTIGNFDYFSNMNFAIPAPGDWYNFYSDIYIDDITVLRDTAQPAISLTEFDLGADTVRLCARQTLTVGGQPDFFHYWWSTGDTTQFIRITEPGTYWCTVDFGCNTYTDTITVIAASDTVKPLNPLPGLYLCDEDGTTVTAPSGYEKYAWSTGDITQSVKIFQPGIYTLEVLDRCGVIYRDTFEAFDAVSRISLGNDTVICNAAMSLILSVPSALTGIQWNTGKTTHNIMVDTPGTYYVTAASPCGILSDTIDIRFCKPEISGIAFSSQTVCAGGCIRVSAGSSNYPQTWQWSFEGGTPGNYSGEDPPVICYDTTGDFNITLIASGAGGSDTFASSVKVLQIPQGRFEDTAISVPYKTRLDLNSCADAQRVYWYRGDSMVCHNCPVYSFEAKDWQAVYYCIAENAEGICRDTCIYKVSVYDIPAEVWLPTAFSPNGDGRNDKFNVVTDNPNFIMHSLSVYNRWGQRIYYGTNEREGWDGTFYGSSVEPGVYYWMLRYRIRGVHQDFYKKGDVAVVK